MAAQFTKTLRKTDIEKRLSLPTYYMKHLPVIPAGLNSVSLAVAEMDGSLRVFVYSIRRHGYRKPVLSAGWRGFVRHKGVKAGDKIVFIRGRRNAAAEYMIGVKRKIKLFGKEIWTAVF